MSTPLVGYPDYQQYPAWRGVTLTEGTVTVGASATQTFGPYPTNNFASVRLVITGDTNGCQVRLFGSSQSNGSNAVFIQWWDIRPSTKVFVVIPILFSYILIDVVGAPGGTNKCYLSVQPVNISPNRNLYVGGNGAATASGVVINNGQVLRFYPYNNVPGPATLWIWGTVNPLPVEFHIMFYDYQDNEFQEIVTWNSPITVNFNTQLTLPESSWRVRVANNSGAAQTFFFSLVPVVSAGG